MGLLSKMLGSSPAPTSMNGAASCVLLSTKTLMAKAHIQSSNENWLKSIAAMYIIGSRSMHYDGVLPIAVCDKVFAKAKIDLIAKYGDRFEQEVKHLQPLLDTICRKHGLPERPAGPNKYASLASNFYLEVFGFPSKGNADWMFVYLEMGVFLVSFGACYDK